MLSVYSALSGELLTVDDFEGKTAEVKELVVVQMGARFQQRFLSEDGFRLGPRIPKGSAGAIGVVPT